MKCGKQGKIKIRRGLYILFQIKIQGQNFVPYERAWPKEIRHQIQNWYLTCIKVHLKN